MVHGILYGLQVLVISDHADLARLFAMALGTYGASAIIASSIDHALRALGRAKPNVVLMDMAVEGNPWRVLVEANGARVPAVAFTFRCPDPREVEAKLRSFARPLRSTDPVEVCNTVREAMAEAG
jgi:DNA-binding NtrC family response regulator